MNVLGLDVGFSITKATNFFCLVNGDEARKEVGLVERAERFLRSDAPELFRRLSWSYPETRWVSVDATAQNRAVGCWYSREMPLTSEEGGRGWWSVDHLFLDQAVVPTLVEVKRSTDTRIRREVVEHLPDYAANGVAYWPVEILRARFEPAALQSGALVLRAK